RGGRVGVCGCRGAYVSTQLAHLFRANSDQTQAPMDDSYRTRPDCCFPPKEAQSAHNSLLCSPSDTHTHTGTHTHTHTHTHSHSHSHRHEDQTNTWRFKARSKCSFGTVGTE